MSRSELQRQLGSWLDHMAWADRHTLESLRRSGGEPGQALEIYAHVLGAEHVWLNRLLGSEPRAAVWPSLGIEECSRLAAENRAGLADFLDGLAPGDLDRSAHYRNSAGLEFDSRVADILAHLFMHGAYHRGQVALLLRNAGFEPAPTDYIAFVRGVPAATRQR